MYLLRLDDASEYMDVDKWNKIEVVLNRYNIKPIVGIIPNNQDESFISKYERYINFWDMAKAWQSSEWTIALHGYTHVYISNSGGINPVNFRSEFAGVTLEKQREKISNGIRILKEHGLNPKVFFAPSHTFDINTIEALRLESEIRIICDTIANDVYRIGDFYFIPQQSGHVRRLPFRITTFCYHPNIMDKQDFNELESFILKHSSKFIKLQDLSFTDRQFSVYDKCLRKSYFLIRNIKSKIKGN